jgi:uncharacterized protein YuzE
MSLLNNKMKLKFHYDGEDDVLSIYTGIAPKETIEFSEFLNIDVDKDYKIVGLEIFEASKFFGMRDTKINKEFLKSIKEVSIEYHELRNMWFIDVIFIDKNNNMVKQAIPPLSKQEYKSPLIAQA